MRVIIVLLGLSLMTGTCAEEWLRDVPLAEARVGRQAPDGSLRVEASRSEPYQSLLEFADPGITLPVYAVKGMIRHENVSGDGYLQLDNHFAGFGTFFTKSLATNGPLMKISGTSGWREFILPFYANQGDQAGDNVLLPEKLTLGVYLPDSGTVMLRDIALFQYGAGEDPLRSAAGKWVDDRTAILGGAIGGGAIGLWGALVGFLASRGKARIFVLGSATALIILGGLSLLAGIAAFASGQAYALYYPMLLIGVIVLLVAGGLRRSLPARYAAHELKKMRAMDI